MLLSNGSGSMVEVGSGWDGGLLAVGTAGGVDVGDGSALLGGVLKGEVLDCSTPVLVSAARFLFVTSPPRDPITGLAALLTGGGFEEEAAALLSGLEFERDLPKSSLRCLSWFWRSREEIAVFSGGTSLLPVRPDISCESETAVADNLGDLA